MEVIVDNIKLVIFLNNNIDYSVMSKISRMYDLWAASYDSPNMLVAMERNVLLDLAGNVKGKRVLDAGCGTGRWSLKFAKKSAKVFGRDISKKMIAKAVAKSSGLDIEYKVGDLNKLHFPRNSFDFVICSLVLDHIKNLNSVFKEFNRVLKKGGICLITTVDPFTPLDVVGARFVHKGRIVWLPSFSHSFEEYFNVIKANHFEIIDLREIAVTEAERRYFEPQEFKVKKGRRTLLIMKLKKK